MESALIVSKAGKGSAFFTELLHAASVNYIITLSSCGEARRFLLERNFDLIIVNEPLSDESGENFSRYIASQGISQVILVVGSEYVDAVSTTCEKEGILVIAKPINKSIFWSAISLAKSAQNHIKRLQFDTAHLTQQIESIRLVSRAKWILMSYMKMNEQEAHRYIEKQAMDTRLTKRIIAEGILRAYDNEN